MTRSWSGQRCAWIPGWNECVEEKARPARCWAAAAAPSWQSGWGSGPAVAGSPAAGSEATGASPQLDGAERRDSTWTNSTEDPGRQTCGILCLRKCELIRRFIFYVYIWNPTTFPCTYISNQVLLFTVDVGSVISSELVFQLHPLNANWFSMELLVQRALHHTHVDNKHTLLSHLCSVEQ